MTYQPHQSEDATLKVATTGWPPSELMQDDCRPLSKWLGTRIDARLHAREAAALIAQGAPTVNPASKVTQPDEQNTEVLPHEHP